MKITKDVHFLYRETLWIAVRSMVVQLAGRLPMDAHVPNALRAMSDDPNERSQVAAGAALGAMLAFDADMHEEAFSTIVGANRNIC